MLTDGCGLTGLAKVTVIFVDGRFADQQGSLIKGAEQSKKDQQKKIKNVAGMKRCPSSRCSNILSTCLMVPKSITRINVADPHQDPDRYDAPLPYQITGLRKISGDRAARTGANCRPSSSRIGITCSGTGKEGLIPQI